MEPVYDAGVPSPASRLDRDVDECHFVDGGDLAYGELLMALVEPMRRLPTGQVVRLVATDPAASFDIPAWCHLTGHGYRGAGEGPDGRPYYDLEVSAHAILTRDGRPWHRDTAPIPQPEGPSTL